MLKIIEIIAVVLSLLYTWLYLHGYPSCFFFGAVGSALFFYLCFKKKIYAETFLQLFYIGASVYGYLHFSEEWNMIHWSINEQLPWLVVACVAAFAIGYFLQKKTDAKLPWLDSTVTVFSILATILMVNYVHENWLYWIIIDATCIFIYLHRRLYFGAALFVIYLVMSVDGFFGLGWI